MFIGLIRQFSETRTVNGELTVVLENYLTREVQEFWGDTDSDQILQEGTFFSFHQDVGLQGQLFNVVDFRNVFAI